MSKQINNLFAQIANDERVTLDADALVAVRSRVLTAIRSQAITPTPTRRVVEAMRAFVPLRQLETFGRATAFAAVSVLALVGGGALSASAYSDALPGDTLYGMRGLVERAQLAVAPSSASRARLLLDITDRRANDVARLADAGSSVEAATQATTDFADATRRLQAELHVAAAADADAATELAKVVERRAATQQEVLRRASRTAVPALQPVVSQAARQSERLTIRALAVLVDQHVGGNVGAPRSVVLVNLEERIATTEAQLPTEQAATDAPTPTEPTRAQRAKVAIEEAKELVKQERFQAALVKIEEAAELAKEPEVTTEPKDEPATEVEPGEGTETPKEENPAEPAKETPTDEPVTTPDDERTSTEDPKTPTEPEQPATETPATEPSTEPAANPTAPPAPETPTQP